MRSIIVLVCFVLLSGFRYETDALIEYYPEPVRSIAYNNKAARFGVLGFNVALGCLKGGIGTDMSFWSGCWRGMIGGAVAYSGQWIASYVGEQPWTGGAGKLIQSAGVSMQDNVAQNLGMFSRYQIDLGPALITLGGGDGFRMSYSLVSAVGIGTAIGRGGKFDWKLSLATLTPIFQANLDADMFQGGENMTTGGIASGGVILMNDQQHPGSFSAVLSHEYMHTLNWNHYRLAGNAFNLYGWDVGRDAAFGLFCLPNLTEKLYWWSPEELIAYTMER